MSGRWIRILFFTMVVLIAILMVVILFAILLQ